MKILCIGHAAYDITYPVDQFPVENTKNRVSNRVECGGGPAANATYLLGKWGMDVSFAGVVGNDEYGRLIEHEFHSVNVDTTYLQKHNQYKTTSSFIIASKEKGSRTILTYRDGMMKLEPFSCSFAPDVILFDGQEIEMTHRLLDQYPHAISIVDAGRPTDEIIELSKRATYLVCSKTFAEELSGISINEHDIDQLELVFKNMEKQFSNTIIVTLEEHGCMYKQDDQVILLPGIKRPVVDPTGAGDIFHGAFTYGIAKNMLLADLLKLSNIAGGLSVSIVGSRYSVPSLDEVMQIYESN